MEQDNTNKAKSPFERTSHLTDVCSSLLWEIVGQFGCVEILHPSPKYDRLIRNIVEQRKNFVPKQNFGKPKLSDEYVL